ncbi:MAG TPA: hypothetical protein VMF03_02890 [Steroidobacteraceae bacterium]|nr:hypothetical protein [Steroidobacteraceae bacterium]
MSEERTEEFSAPRVNVNLAVSGDVKSGDQEPRADAQRKAEPGKETEARKESGDKDRKGKTKKVSAAKVQLQGRLPALVDDADIGVEKEQIVTRDGKPDLLFMGTLMASAAPATAPKGRWQEYRIYMTAGGKHVFAKVSRSVFEDDEDSHEAEVFDPAPSSVPSQLMRSAREIARAKPMTWMDAAVSFFGYDPLAKALYRKLSVRFEEQIT